jgi:hypothetical protein
MICEHKGKKEGGWDRVGLAVPSKGADNGFLCGYTSSSCSCGSCCSFLFVVILLLLSFRGGLKNLLAQGRT